MGGSIFGVQITWYRNRGTVIGSVTMPGILDVLPVSRKPGPVQQKVEVLGTAIALMEVADHPAAADVQGGDPDIATNHQAVVVALA